MHATKETWLYSTHRLRMLEGLMNRNMSTGRNMSTDLVTLLNDVAVLKLTFTLLNCLLLCSLVCYYVHIHAAVHEHAVGISLAYCRLGSFIIHQNLHKCSFV